MEYLPLIIGVIIVVLRLIGRNDQQKKQVGPKAQHTPTPWESIFTGDILGTLRTAIREESALQPQSSPFGEEGKASKDEMDAKAYSSLEYTPLDTAPPVEPLFAAQKPAALWQFSRDMKPALDEAPYALRQRRYYNGSALHIARTLSTTEGMAQAVVMAEVLQGRGGKGKPVWRR